MRKIVVGAWLVGCATGTPLEINDDGNESIAFRDASVEDANNSFDAKQAAIDAANSLTGVRDAADPLMGNSDGDSTISPTIAWLDTSVNDGYIALSVTMTIEALGDAAVAPWFWAHQASFRSGDSFFMGLQPDNGRGKRALFSLFASDAGVLSPDSCHEGANNSPGVSCAIPFDWLINRVYRFSASLDHQASTLDVSAWLGTVSDVTTASDPQIIGEWTLPSSRGTMKPELLSYAEWFGANVACSEFVPFRVKYLFPLVTDALGNDFVYTSFTFTKGTCANIEATVDGVRMVVGD